MCLVLYRAEIMDLEFVSSNMRRRCCTPAEARQDGHLWGRAVGISKLGMGSVGAP